MASVAHLKRRKDVLYVLQRGQRERGVLFRVHVAARETRTDPIRAAVIARAKEHPMAVTRNRVRRRTYEAIGHSTRLLRGYDIVVFPATGVSHANFLTLCKELSIHATHLTRHRSPH